MPVPNAPARSKSVAVPTATPSEAQCESPCTPIHSPTGNRANPTVRSAPTGWPLRASTIGSTRHSAQTDCSAPPRDALRPASSPNGRSTSLRLGQPATVDAEEMQMFRVWMQAHAAGPRRRVVAVGARDDCLAECVVGPSDSAIQVGVRAEFFDNVDLHFDPAGADFEMFRPDADDDFSCGIGDLARQLDRPITQ